MGGETEGDAAKDEREQLALYADILEANVLLVHCMTGVIHYLSVRDRITCRLRDRLTEGKALADSILRMRAEMTDKFLFEATAPAAENAEQALFVYRDVEETMQVTITNPCVAM